MTAQTWFLFCITELVLCLIPGPAVLLVLSVRMVCSRSAQHSAVSSRASEVADRVFVRRS